MSRSPVAASALCALALGWASSVLAAPREQAEGSDQAASLHSLAGPPRGYMRVLGSLALGQGLRFNNPYRLETPLGDTAESVSTTAPYVDLAMALAFGPPNGLQHGGALHLATALSGIAQTVITPSYLAVYRGPHRAMVCGRLGLPVIVNPDTNVGGELALGGAYFLTAGIGLSAELAFDLFYGAGTRQTSYAVYPILAGQFGVLIDYEVLP